VTTLEPRPRSEVPGSASTVPHAAGAARIPRPTTAQSPTALVITRGNGAGKVVPLGGEHVRIGRCRDCDIVMDDPTVSECHAEIRLDECGRYVIADLDSFTGVFVNRAAIDATTRLCDGDEIWIGKARFTFHDRTPYGQP
jgi:pSer/pThr/pTyr-binding forkhead associated (FHA) protein